MRKYYFWALWAIKDRLSKARTHIGYWIAQRTPRFVRYFVILDATAKASTSPAHSNQTPYELNWDDILDYS